jgi:hypothetical protein
MRKLSRRYYVGASHISDAVANNSLELLSNLHSSLDAAIKDAKEKIIRGERDTCIIVEIIRVVRKTNPIPPIVVEEVYEPNTRQS